MCIYNYILCRFKHVQSTPFGLWYDFVERYWDILLSGFGGMMCVLLTRPGFRTTVDFRHGKRHDQLDIPGAETVGLLIDVKMLGWELMKPQLFFVGARVWFQKNSLGIENSCTGMFFNL